MLKHNLHEFANGLPLRMFPLMVALLVVQLASRAGAGDAPKPPTVRFGATADCHLLARRTPGSEAFLRQFVDEMARWKPDFVITLGDFACQAGEGPTTAELHDAQLQGLEHHWNVFSEAPCPAYLAIGNHDVGWFRGGGERLDPQDLYGHSHGGEDITKAELLAVTKLPARYYAFDVRKCHFIVLDANNAPDTAAPARGHDGVPGGYFIDREQIAWLKQDLAASKGKTKVVFCHQELHHTPPEGSREGGDAPFPPVGKEGSYVDNGWQLRNLFSADGSVLVCFAGHKHRNRWTVHGGVNYITLAATHYGGSYAKITISKKLHVEGHANQRSYTIPRPTATRN